MRAYRAELGKLASLPSVWAALAVGVLGPAAIAWLNRGKGGADAGFLELGLGVVGAMILGVVVASSEYFTEGESAGGGRQITTSLSVVPSRSLLLLAKVAALTTFVCALGVVAVAVVHPFAGLVTAANTGRLIGLLVYWALTALLAFGITLLTRNGIVPLTVLILNSSVVSASFLLTKVTSLAVYLPELAGMRMFATRIHVPVLISPVTGGLVMAAWTFGLLAVAGTVFVRRDA